jgi:hypothetical protein
MRVVTQVALTGMQVVTQDFGRKSKLVVTQASTVLPKKKKHIFL